MSEKPLEDLKRICLICGCHTNQTINIFEPRSGPNIVELIQVKFKFQPLNEDKYLCYSCNNWLINWHSLQAVNCNDESENQSGKFRCQINGAIPEEELDKFQRMPYLPSIESMPNTQLKGNGVTKATETVGSRKGRCLSFSKRSTMIGRNRIRKTRRKCELSCFLCGRTLTKRLPLKRRCTTKGQLCPLKCLSCRRILKWHANYLRKLFEEDQHKLKQKKFLNPNDLFNFRMNLVNAANDFSNNTLKQNDENQYPNIYKSNQSRRHHYQSQTLVDGKVISMLKRLGTTLSQEKTHSADGRRMSKVLNSNKKSPQKPKWSRKLADDEILIDFNTAITEVLPFRNIRKKLKYQISSLSNFDDMETIEIHSDESDNDLENDFDENVVNENFDDIYNNYDNNDEDDIDEEEEGYGSGSEQSFDEIDMEEIYGKLPKGLTVSLITNEGVNGHL